jgi:hypothetical protein
MIEYNNNTNYRSIRAIAKYNSQDVKLPKKQKGCFHSIPSNT